MLFYLTFCLLLLSQSVQSSSSASFPLRWHDSPWLHKDFIIRPEDEPTSEPEPHSKCDETSGGEYGSESEQSCWKDECTFNPSAFCIVKWKKRLAEMAEDGLDVDTLLDKIDKQTTTTTKSETASEIGSDGPQFERCDFLTERIIDDMCRSDRRNIRAKLLENLKLRSCRRFSLTRTLQMPFRRFVANSTDCASILRELLVLDDLVERLACEYESILMRYDCKAKWSSWECQDCRVSPPTHSLLRGKPTNCTSNVPFTFQLAYRDWLCSTLLPFHDEEGNPIKPCQSICEQVEQKCPHLHPYGKGQYAGEPVFLCIGMHSLNCCLSNLAFIIFSLFPDANIPFDDKIIPESNMPYGLEGKCYNLCDLETCQNDDGERPKLSCWKRQVVEELTTTESPENRTFSQYTDSGTTHFAAEDALTTLGNHEFNEIEGHTLKTTTEMPGNGGENDFEELSAKQDTTTLAWSSSADDDDMYYLLQVNSDAANQQSQSAQYLELEPPSYENKKAKNLYSLETYDGTENAMNGNYQASLQDMYHEAISATTIDSSLSIEAVEKELNLNDEFTKEEISDEWINVAANTLPKTTPQSPYEAYPEIPTVATGTQAPKTSPTGANKLGGGHREAVKGKGANSVKGSSDTAAASNRFRHHNSRSKEQQAKNVVEHRGSNEEKSGKTHPDSHTSGKKNVDKESHTAKRIQPQTKSPSRRTAERPLKAQLLTVSNSSKTWLFSLLMMIIFVMMACLAVTF